jgi:hypothetical protein
MISFIGESYNPDLCPMCRLKKAMTGWTGYGWKDGQYIDFIQDYFDKEIKKS